MICVVKILVVCFILNFTSVFILIRNRLSVSIVGDILFSFYRYKFILRRIVKSFIYDYFVDILISIKF